jgi:4-amino-4-deoxy-L-arabinose transferase-like glycosyltransferase
MSTTSFRSRPMDTRDGTITARRPQRVRRTLRRVPLAAWVCAAIACVNGICWAATTPPYWAPDEIVSIGYVQYIGENGDVPRRGVGGDFSEEMFALPFSVEGRPPWLAAEERSLFRNLDRDLGRSRPGQADYLVNYPPLYYALDAIPYRIAYGANFADRVFAMRLLSPLLGALTVLFVFMFLRELLPSTPWAWTVGALAVAFQPMFGFMSGAVNNDNLLYACSAALLFLIARAFARGLNMKVGVAIGLTVAAGLLTKQSILGLIPGTALGLTLIVLRAPRSARRPPLTGALAAAGVGLLPWVAWLAIGNLVLHRAASDTGGITSGVASQIATVSGQLSYLWQALLPRLPFMNDFFPWYVPYEIYFQGFIGRFGWAEYSFPLTFHRIAIALFAVLTMLAGSELWRRREVLSARWPEALTYVAMFGGLVLLIEIAAYRYHIAFFGQYFEQGRYLLPMLALYGAFVALAARGAGRKWGPAVGAFLVVLAMGHSLFAMILTIDRFYV